MYILNDFRLGNTLESLQKVQSGFSDCYEKSPCAKDIPRDFLLLNSKPLEELLPRLKKIDQFQFGQHTIRTFHRPIIRLIAAMVTKKAAAKPYKTIFIIGATDGVGGFDENCALGKARAQSVRNELIRVLERLRPGITKDINFVVLSNGECSPIVKKVSRKNRNRYVQLWFSEEYWPKTLPPSRVPHKPKSVWKTRPLPDSEFYRFEKALENLKSELSKIKDPRMQRYLCWFDKLKKRDTDDRIIGWSKICPSTSGAIGAAFVVGACDITQGTPVNQEKLEKAIRSASDVETANQSLEFITYMRSAIVVSFEMTSLPVENLRRQTDDASRAITKLNQWANAPLGGSSAMPTAYRAIISWLVQRQKDPKSLYSCF